MVHYQTQFSCILDVKTSANAVEAVRLYQLFRDESTEQLLTPGFIINVSNGASELHLYHDAAGDVESLIDFVKRLAIKFNLTGNWGFQYANTCNRHRLDGFGGGAHMINLETAETVAWTDTNTWLANALQEASNRA